MTAPRGQADRGLAIAPVSKGLPQSSGPRRASVLCRGAWARVTIDQPRSLAPQADKGHRVLNLVSMNSLANQMFRFVERRTPVLVVVVEVRAVVEELPHAEQREHEGAAPGQPAAHRLPCARGGVNLLWNLFT